MHSEQASERTSIGNKVNLYILIAIYTVQTERMDESLLIMLMLFSSVFVCACLLASPMRFDDTRMNQIFRPGMSWFQYAHRHSMQMFTHIQIWCGDSFPLGMHTTMSTNQMRHRMYQFRCSTVGVHWAYTVKPSKIVNDAQPVAERNYVCSFSFWYSWRVWEDGKSNKTMCNLLRINIITIIIIIIRIARKEVKRKKKSLFSLSPFVSLPSIHLCVAR